MAKNTDLNHGHGGGYDVQFLGTVTIPR